MSKKNPNLTAEQKLVMFEDGTEPPGTSELNNEKRNGSYHCANCGIKLFESESKYESGSGWPSFYDSLPDVFETKTDHLLGYARTEYHCKKCGGHHGHIFEDGTEPPGTSELNNEKRNGSYHCANCGVKLFESETKYESGSGWPSFFQSLPDVFETKTDHLLGYARTEYHCKNCDAHHGHIFDDGPKPTGKRYCNNGVCLVFKPKN